MDPNLLQILDIGSKATTIGVLIWVVKLMMADRERVAAMFIQVNVERMAMAKEQNEAIKANTAALATFTATLTFLREQHQHKGS